MRKFQLLIIIIIQMACAPNVLQAQFSSIEVGINFQPTLTNFIDFERTRKTTRYARGVINNEEILAAGQYLETVKIERYVKERLSIGFGGMASYSLGSLWKMKAGLWYNSTKQSIGSNFLGRSKIEFVEVLSSQKIEQDRPPSPFMLTEYSSVEAMLQDDRIVRGLRK